MINTRAVAEFKAKPTCISQRSCGECVELARTSEFGCMWCETTGHCSDGADRLRERWNENQCHLTNTTTCHTHNDNHIEWRTSHGSLASSSDKSQAIQTSTVLSAVVSSVCVLILVILFIIFIYLYGKYNQETAIGRYIKTMQESYHQFGDKSKFKSFPSLELGKKISEKAKAKVKPAREFVNPHPMANNNNVITASM